jgi:hypothetical protein
MKAKRRGNEWKCSGGKNGQERRMVWMRESISGV